MEAKQNLWYKIRHTVGNKLYWVILLILVVWTLFPLAWAFSSSFKGRFEVYETPPTIIPHEPTINNYIEVFKYQHFGRLLFNSIFIAAVSTVLALIISVLAGYGFARFKFRYSTLLLLLVLIPRIIPRASIIIPLFRIAAGIGLLNTYTALIVSYTASAVPLSTWILTGFFKGIPTALEDAGRIDGLSPLQTIWYIIIPLSLPAILTVIILSIRQSWNEFPFVMALTTKTKMRTLPYQLFSLQATIGVINWPMILAFALITILPILAIYIFFQRRVVSGIVAGAIK